MKHTTNQAQKRRKQNNDVLEREIYYEMGPFGFIRRFLAWIAKGAVNAEKKGNMCFS